MFCRRGKSGVSWCSRTAQPTDETEVFISVSSALPPHHLPSFSFCFHRLSSCLFHVLSQDGFQPKMLGGVWGVLFIHSCSPLLCDKLTIQIPANSRITALKGGKKQPSVKSPLALGPLFWSILLPGNSVWCLVRFWKALACFSFPWAHLCTFGGVSERKINSLSLIPRWRRDEHCSFTSLRIFSQ